MTVTDARGRAHHAAGSPASTGGQYARQAAPAASAALADQAEVTLEDQAGRTSNALLLDANEGRGRAEQAIRDALPSAVAFRYGYSRYDGSEGGSAGLYLDSAFDDAGQDVLAMMDEHDRQLLAESFHELAASWAEVDGIAGAGYILDFDQAEEVDSLGLELAAAIDTGLDPEHDTINAAALAAHQSVALAKAVERDVWEIAESRGLGVSRVQMSRPTTGYDLGRVEVQAIWDEHGDLSFDRGASPYNDYAELADEIGSSLDRTNEMIGGAYWLADRKAEAVQAAGSGNINATRTPLSLTDMHFRQQRGLTGGTALFGSDHPTGDPYAID